MRETAITCTVLFEDPFWIGLLEREHGGRYEAAKIRFGAEPKNNEVYLYLLQNWRAIVFSPPVNTETAQARRINPKRMQRQINRQMAVQSVGTKAQQALSLMREEMKTKRQTVSREQREAEKQRKFELKQEKRLEKHKGH